MYKIIFLVVLLIFSSTINAEVQREIKIKEIISFSNDEKCAADSIKISPDSKKITVACQNRITGKYYWKINNNKLSTHDGLGSVFQFAPDSFNYAYIAIEDGNRVLIINNKKQIFNGKISAFILFSPDSNHLISVIEKNKNSFKIVKDGKEENSEWEFIDNIIYSPDSKKYLYIAADHEYAYLIENEKVLVKEKKQYMLNTKENKRQLANFIKVNYSPDSQNIFYSNLNEKKKMSQFMNGNRISEFYDEVYPIVFSPKSNDFGFIGLDRKLNKAYFIKNDKKTEGYDSYCFFIDLNKQGDFAYIAGNDNQTILFNGEKKEIISTNTNKKFGTIKFSPNGKRLVYYVQEKENMKNKSYLVFDGIEGQKLDGVEKVNFSKDSKYLFYTGYSQMNNSYNADIYINQDNGNGKYKYFRISDFYYDDNARKLFYVVVLLDDLSHLYIMEEQINEK